MTFKPGDVVMLTSGGKAMTVLSATDDEVTCLWMTEAGQLHRESIPAVALEPIFGDDDEEEEDDDVVVVEDDEDEDDEDDDEDGDDAPAPGTKGRRAKR